MKIGRFVRNSSGMFAICERAADGAVYRWETPSNLDSIPKRRHSDDVCFQRTAFLCDFIIAAHLTIVDTNIQSDNLLLTREKNGAMT